MGIKRRSGGWLINHQFEAYLHLVALIIFLCDLIKLQETCAALSNQSMCNTGSHISVTVVSTSFHILKSPLCCAGYVILGQDFI